MSWQPRNFLALLIASMACWLQRHAAAEIEYLKAENHTLRAKLGRRRIVFTNAERQTLGTFAKEVGRKALRDLDPIVSPATLLRWHRELVAQKWTFLERRQPGRPRTKIKRHLIVDRDTKYSTNFRNVIEREGVEVIRLPPRSPNLNAYAERFVRSVKEECVSKLIPIGSGMLRRSLREYLAHYHRERNHQGLGNRLILPLPIRDRTTARIQCRSRLGGLLRYYERGPRVSNGILEQYGIAHSLSADACKWESSELQ